MWDPRVPDSVALAYEPELFGLVNLFSNTLLLLQQDKFYCTICHFVIFMVV